MYLSEPDEVLLPPKDQWKRMRTLFVGLAIVGFQVGMLVVLSNSVSDRHFGIAMLVALSLGMLFLALTCVPGNSVLRLNPEGLAIRSLWRTTFYRWSDIERFDVAEFRTYHTDGRRCHRFVGFVFSTDSPHRGHHQIFKRFRRRLVGVEAVLPDNYGMEPEALARHLNWRKEQYTAPQ